MENTYISYAAFIDCIRWCTTLSKRELAKMQFIGDAYRCRLTNKAVEKTFTLGYDEGGEIHLYYPAGADHLWLGSLPWESLLVSKKRTLVALVCPPITPPQPFPSICSSYFCLDIPCSPTLFDENVLTNSLGIRGGRYINGVLTPMGEKKSIPVVY